jgi:flagellar basal body L-ring protein FlgH
MIRTIILFCMILLHCSIFCTTVWQERNLYSSAESLKQGDTVTVVVNDIARLRYDLSVDNKSTSAVSAEPDQTITAFLPKVSSSKDINNSDSVQVNSRSNMTLTIAATVTGRAANGNYTLQGNRQYVVNGVASGLAVTGEINPQSLRGTKVLSDNVVNFRMVITTTKQGLGLNLTRQLAPDAAASPDLTEAEKQTIITDYLQKMLDELTR